MNVTDATAQPSAPTPESSKKKKKGKEKEVAKDKKKDRSKGKKRKSGSDDEDDDEWNEFARDSYSKKTKKLPGQLENCEVCEKRFTVTPYSKTGPDGGLLCTSCGKDLAKETAAEKKPKAPATARKRRKVESDRLDGRLNVGAKSLQQLCIEKVVQYHQDIEELGDLPEDVLERLGEIFTKRRVLKPETLKLFLRSDLDQIVINDCACTFTSITNHSFIANFVTDLHVEDYEQIFSIAQKASRVTLKNACQFQNKTMDYMTEKAHHLRELKLYAANLVSDKAWQSFFQARGKQLEALQLQWLDASFDEDSLTEMAIRCPNMSRLKLYRCRLLGEEAVNTISTMKSLQHLSLYFSQSVSNDVLVNLIEKVGKNLRTLSLTGFQDADDTFLAMLHKTCQNLEKLRLAENDTFSDAGIVHLFKGWTNPPLLHIDFNSTRDVDNSNPEGPEDPIGVADAGFRALMEHSGEKIEKLNIASCRHITAKTFMEVFDGLTVYPELREIDVSFCGNVDTVVVAGIFKTCPKLQKLVVFGCFAVENFVVPANVLVIGAPRAQDAIEQFGNTGLNVDQALGGMLNMIKAAA